jgi:hypothetical protein
MPAKLGAQCAFGMFIAILMTGIFQEARAEPVVLRPLTPDEGIEIARAGAVVLRPPASPGGGQLRSLRPGPANPQVTRSAVEMAQSL